MKLWWRLLFSILGIFAFSVLLAYLGGIQSFGTVLFFVDSVSLLLIFFYTTVTSLITYSFREGWVYLRMTWREEEQDKKDLERGIRFFRHLGGLVLLSGALGFLFGLVLMLGNLEDTAHVGPNLAVALISLLYAVMIKMVVIQPLENHLVQRSLE